MSQYLAVVTVSVQSTSIFSRSIMPLRRRWSSRRPEIGVPMIPSLAVSATPAIGISNGRRDRRELSFRRPPLGVNYADRSHPGVSRRDWRPRSRNMEAVARHSGCWTDRLPRHCDVPIADRLSPQQCSFTLLTAFRNCGHPAGVEKGGEGDGSDAWSSFILCPFVRAVAVRDCLGHARSAGLIARNKRPAQSCANCAACTADISCRPTNAGH